MGDYSRWLGKASLEKMMPISVFPSPLGWWEYYVRPKLTWESLGGYRISLGLLASQPPATILSNARIQGYLAGLLEGEGYFYYTRYGSGWSPCIYLRMCEERPIHFFSKILNVEVNSVQKAYVTRTKGLRTILLARLIRPMLTGKRRLAAELFENRGYLVVRRNTLEEYARFYKNPLRKPRRYAVVAQPPVSTQ